MFLHSLIFIFMLFFFFSCQNKNSSNSQNDLNSNREKKTGQERVNTDMKIFSSSFNDGDMIPSKYTCDGDNISPPLSWTGVPNEAKSLTLIVDDPDAPSGVWVHWVIYKIPPAVLELKENVSKNKVLDNGSIQGKNDFNDIGYGGPCPPGGKHRYFFKLYALDNIIEDSGLTKADLIKAMETHIIARAQIIGTYKR